MNKQELQRLRDLPIEGVAERLGLRVQGHKSLCPFHKDSHPSLSYNVRKNFFHCFVCDSSGGTIDLVMRHLDMDFKDACRWLAGENNMILDEWKPAPALREHIFDPKRYEGFFSRPWLSSEARRFLYDERMIDARVVVWCRLTSWRDKQGTNWLQIPYYDSEGKLIGIQNRNLDYRKGTDMPRFRFPQGSRCTIYNLPVLKMLRQGEPLFITEGCSDCWAMLSAGYKAIAIPSATLLKPTDVELLEQVAAFGTTFHMYPDQDTPGECLFLQLKDKFPNMVRHQLPLECKDFSEYYVIKKK